MKSKILFGSSICLLFFFLIFQNSCIKDIAPLPKPKINKCSAVISYSVSIVPIMTTYCTTKGCHNPTGSGTGDYTTYAGLAAKADAPLGNGSLRKRAIDGDPTWMPSPNGL